MNRLSSLTYFTVAADFRALVADFPSDPDPDPQIVPITGSVTFTPLLNSGDAILATTATPPTVFVPAPIQGVIDADGTLKLRSEPDPGSTGFVPVRLLADQPALELKEPLFYRVDFTNLRFYNRPGNLASFTFQAPNADTVLNLVTCLRQPGAVGVGITKIAPGAVRMLEDGRHIQFSFGGVDIPDAVSLEVVNGPQGPQGVQGAQGATGAQGVQGAASTVPGPPPTLGSYVNVPAPKPGKWVSFGGGTVTTMAGVVNQLFLRKYHVAAAARFDRIGCDISTQGAGSTVRLGIYNSDDNGAPTTLIADCGTVDASTSGVKEIVINQTLPAGVYFLAALTHNAACQLRAQSGVPNFFNMRAWTWQFAFGDGFKSATADLGANLPADSNTGWGLVPTSPIPMLLMRAA